LKNSPLTETDQGKCGYRFVELESCEGELDIEHPLASENMEGISLIFTEIVGYANQRKSVGKGIKSH